MHKETWSKVSVDKACRLLPEPGKQVLAGPETCGPQLTTPGCALQWPRPLQG